MRRVDSKRPKREVYQGLKSSSAIETEGGAEGAGSLLKTLDNAKKPGFIVTELQRSGDLIYAINEEMQ